LSVVTSRTGVKRVSWFGARDDPAVRTHARAAAANEGATCSALRAPTIGPVTAGRDPTRATATVARVDAALDHVRDEALGCVGLERAQRLLDRRVEVALVHEADVDPVRTRTPQAGLDGGCGRSPCRRGRRRRRP